MLKGGIVLELRLERARTTKDVDLRLAGSSDDILARLQAAGRLDLGDFMTFEVGFDPDTPDIVGDGVQYDGHRFRAECRLAGIAPATLRVIPSRRTSPKSSTPIRCRASARTRA